MFFEDTKYKNPDKIPFLIYADIEYIIGKIGGRKNNVENSSTTKVRFFNV